MIIVRYGEISLKKGKRRIFERKLAENIKNALRKNGIDCKIKILRGRIIVDAPEHAKNIISNQPGVVSVSPATEMNYDEIKEYLKKKLQGLNPKSFKVDTQRVDKTFPLKSMEINEEIGAFVVKNFGWRVNLTNPEFIIGIEIILGKAYVFFEKIRGPGGLPVGIEGRVIALISGGIDSPVAAYLMMKRGVEVIALHFHQNEKGQKIVEKMIKSLSKYSPNDIKLIVESHYEILKPYVLGLNRLNRREWTCVFCKVAMLRRAKEIAIKEGALGIITGDSLGQVASQTLHHLYIETKSVDFPIYRPLIGFDKNETISIAKKIGTYDIFLENPHCNCPFRPQRVITQGNYEEFRDILSKLSDF